MSAQVLYNSPSEAVAITSVEFLNGSGSVTDPELCYLRGHRSDRRDHELHVLDGLRL